MVAEEKRRRRGRGGLSAFVKKKWSSVGLWVFVVRHGGGVYVVFGGEWLMVIPLEKGLGGVVGVMKVVRR